MTSMYPLFAAAVLLWDGKEMENKESPLVKTVIGMVS